MQDEVHDHRSEGLANREFGGRITVAGLADLMVCGLQERPETCRTLDSSSATS
jgi:hypothetical protein